MRYEKQIQKYVKIIYAFASDRDMSLKDALTYIGDNYDDFDDEMQNAYDICYDNI